MSGNMGLFEFVDIENCGFLISKVLLAEFISRAENLEFLRSPDGVLFV